jgi:hypothetical protein
MLRAVPLWLTVTLVTAGLMLGACLGVFTVALLFAGRVPDTDYDSETKRDRLPHHPRGPS